MPNSVEYQAEGQLALMELSDQTCFIIRVRAFSLVPRCRLIGISATHQVRRKRLKVFVQKRIAARSPRAGLQRPPGHYWRRPP